MSTDFNPWDSGALAFDANPHLMAIPGLMMDPSSAFPAALIAFAIDAIGMGIGTSKGCISDMPDGPAADSAASALPVLRFFLVRFGFSSGCQIGRAHV